MILPLLRVEEAAACFGMPLVISNEIERDKAPVIILGVVDLSQPDHIHARSILEATARSGLLDRRPPHRGQNPLSG
jgi:hypothetical protein